MRKRFEIGYKDRPYVNYLSIMTAFIIPLKQLNKVIDNNNVNNVSNYLISFNISSGSGNIIQVNNDYSMINGVITYSLDNNNNTISFTKKKSFQNVFLIHDLTYDYGGVKLKYFLSSDLSIICIYPTRYTTSIYQPLLSDPWDNSAYDARQGFLILYFQVEFLQIGIYHRNKL